MSVSFLGLWDCRLWIGMGERFDRYRSGTNVVLLDPDVADAFPTAESVNEALRMLLTIAQRQEQTVPVE